MRMISQRLHRLPVQDSRWQREIIFWVLCLIVSLAILVATLETVRADELTAAIHAPAQITQ